MSEKKKNTSFLTLNAKLHIGTFRITKLLFRFVLKMYVTYNIADRIQDGAAIPSLRHSVYNTYI